MSQSKSHTKFCFNTVAQSVIVMTNVNVATSEMTGKSVLIYFRHSNNWNSTLEETMKCFTVIYVPSI